MTVHCLRDANKLFALLVLNPTVLLAILACAGSWTIPVFTLSLGDGGPKTHIGAQGYWTDRADYAQHPKWNWAVPPTWPKTVQHIPLLLLFHFIAAVMLLVYLVVLLASMCPSSRKYYRMRAVLKQPGWLFLPAVCLALGVLGLCMADAIVWGLARPDGLNADVLGYFVVIAGISVAVEWLWALCSALVRPEEYVWKTRDDEVSSYLDQSKSKRSKDKKRRGNAVNKLIYR